MVWENIPFDKGQGGGLRTNPVARLGEGKVNGGTNNQQGGGDITEMENSYYGFLLRFITVYYGYYGVL